MKKTTITIAGDVPGSAYSLPVLTFEGRDPDAPKVYIQAALHANELPGVAAAHFLVPMLAAAEEKGEILGTITVVPQANPIGASQFFHGELQGRFDLASRNNFNRDYPLVTTSEKDTLLDTAAGLSAIDQLKRHLLAMAVKSDLMLDLHCDSESTLYAYIHEAFWPEALDLAESMGLDAVLLSDGDSSAFEDAVSHAWRMGADGEIEGWAKGRLSLTMEFRGQLDVDPVTAKRDATGLYAFLQRRGVISGELMRRETFYGPIAGLDYVQMVDAPAAGTVIFEKTFGETVKKGDRLATVVPEPGNPAADHIVTAPTDGYIVTRVLERLVRRGDNLMKIASSELSHAVRKPGGGLED